MVDGTAFRKEITVRASCDASCSSLLSYAVSGRIFVVHQFIKLLLQWPARRPAACRGREGPERQGDNEGNYAGTVLGARGIRPACIPGVLIEMVADVSGREVASHFLGSLEAHREAKPPANALELLRM